MTGTPVFVLSPSFQTIYQNFISYTPSVTVLMETRSKMYPYRNFTENVIVYHSFQSFLLDCSTPATNVLDYLGTFLSYERLSFTEFWRRKAPFDLYQESQLVSRVFFVLRAFRNSM
jgi:hypothetical protein